MLHAKHRARGLRLGAASEKIELCPAVRILPAPVKIRPRADVHPCWRLPNPGGECAFLDPGRTSRRHMPEFVASLEVSCGSKDC